VNPVIYGDAVRERRQARAVREAGKMKTALCAAAIGVAMLTGYGLSAQPAQAGYVVDLTQQGANVVETGNGSLDLTALTFLTTNSPPAGGGTGPH
jgi:hypothetical protein